MNDRIVMLFGLFALGAAAHGSPAHAQAHAGSQDLQIYAGEMFGDRLTEAPLTGRHPLLNDDAIFGGRYTYDFTDQWGVLLSSGYSPDRVSRALSGDTDVGLVAVDLDVLWNVTPGFTLDGRTLAPYTEIGVGYAWANFDHPLYGVVGANPLTLTGSNGYTANIGLGAKYYLTSNFFVDFDARYRYLSRLINNESQALNTGETTLGLGYQF